MGSVTPDSINKQSAELTLLTSERYELFPSSEHTKLRRTVPVCQDESTTYLNASFQQPMNLKVRAALEQFLDQATTLTHPKPIWQQATCQARTKIAAYLNVPEQSVAFTRDTTEGLNLFQRSLKLGLGDNVVVLDVEHPTHVYGWLGLVEQGLEVRRIPTGSETYADAATFAPYVDDRTIAIRLSSIMFHDGQMNIIRDICSRFRSRSVHVIVDITQHVGVAPIDLTTWGVSAAAFSVHKGLGCPSGLGGLYIAPDVLPTLKAVPPMVGAGAIANLPNSLIQDLDVQYHATTQRYEHLNLSFVGAVALNASLDFILGDMGIFRLENHLRALGRELVLGCKSVGVEAVGSCYAEHRAPHLYVLKLLHPDWQAQLREKQIFVSHYHCGVRVSFWVLQQP